MTVKIDLFNNADTGKQSDLKSTNTKPSNTANVGEAYHTNLSVLANQIRQLQTQLIQPNSGDFDVEKVNQIQLAIRQGKYHIDPSKIADGILESAQELLKKP